MGLTSIITVNYNQPQVTVAFLRSVQQFTDPAQVEIIVVDNGSVEDHEEEFKQAFPGLVYMRSEKNIGFAGGNNLGIAAARGEHLLFLNNDTEITANLVETLSAALNENEDIGMISPLILYYDHPGVIQYAGYTKMNYLTCRNSGIGSMEVNAGQYDHISRQTFYCHGAAMMCRTADLKEVGLMEDDYFLYYEEYDWCEKFKRAGKKIWFTGNARVFHKESISVGKKSAVKTYFMTRNRMLFIRRNTGYFNTLCFSLYYIFIACPKQILLYMKEGRPDLVKWVYRGIKWNITHSKNDKSLGINLNNMQ